MYIYILIYIYTKIILKKNFGNLAIILSFSPSLYIYIY